MAQIALRLITSLALANSFRTVEPTELGWLHSTRGLRSDWKVCVCSVTQSCPTLCDHMNHSLPGFFVHGDSPCKNTGVGCHVLLQGIFPTQGQNPGLPYCRWILYLWATRSPWILEWVAYAFSKDLPDPGIKPGSPALQVDSLPLELPGKVKKKWKVKVAQSCPTLWDPIDYRVHGILQARILEWIAVPFSRGSFQCKDRTQVSHIAGGFFTSWATREAQEYWSG